MKKSFFWIFPRIVHSSSSKGNPAPNRNQTEMTTENDTNSAVLENDSVLVAASSGELSQKTSDGDVPPSAAEGDAVDLQSQNPADDLNAEPLTQPLSQNPVDEIEMNQDKPSTEIADKGKSQFALVFSSYGL
jgi:hypothetical protein